MFGLSELAILLIVVLVVFGARKLPELARNAGRAARILRSEARAAKEPHDKPGAPGDSGALEGRIVEGPGGPSGAPRP
ncbi:twin-arginine translocase TatA/TatE family subunit [Streptomyces sp. C10-9-1]|uniref:Sec-independent protein translocase subunit TatA/TatB n=1 Tax=Streptomyces sp. C10-9-1 TaxID=1859285 RepID=UPI002112A40E|nr:twin-arginine translocase TatA/TatE family subunit [Streptomyces sp. C10-9-1]MCQ6552274.1 twin-arginine translocase TatA/TatE family subunit [Streptomyces sp. C10-9-1]